MMIFASLMLFAFLYKITNNYLISLFSLLTLFVASGFMRIHMNCFYSERMIFFMLSAFMLCRHKAQAEQSTAYYVLAFLSTVYATYLKEPVFGAIAIIATVSLLSDKLSRKEKVFNYALLLNSVVFVVIYVYLLLFKKRGKAHATIITSISDFSFRQFDSEPLLYLVLLLTLISAYKILIKKDRVTAPDSSLFAGGGYAFVYAILNLAYNYYFIPVIVLFVPAFAVFLSNSKAVVRCIAMSLVVVCSWNSVNYSKNLVLDVWEHRKNDHLFFEYLVKEHKSGKGLFWLSEPWLEANDLEYKLWDEVWFDRYHQYIGYYSGFTCKLERVFDLDKFNKNSLIICGIGPTPIEVINKIYDKLTKLGFKKIKEFSCSFTGVSSLFAGAIVFAHD
jgi:hypothetical protein